MLVADLLWIALALLATYAMLAPLESLRWWTRQGRDRVRRTVHRMLGPIESDGEAESRPYLVYLSGVGLADETAFSRRESAMLDMVREAIPEAVVLADVFPYSVQNRGLLTGPGRRTRFWDWLRRTRRGRIPAFYLIYLRNLFQMLVSADHRYGPAYNYGVALEIWKSLARAGYSLDSGSPVFLVGFSGGGQIALGAAWHLGMAGVRVSVISIGGILSDDPGIEQVRHLWHLHGSKDPFHRLGAILFPGRWPINPLSGWNRADKAGRITRVELPGVIHDGKGDYFDPRPVDGLSHAERTAAHIIAAIRSQAAPTAPS